ncbi:MAG: putative toxin-antitoxin system toxin component, PIN family [Zoogloeaceae bacterium]|jgi:putative PIN family toxin of toxin-antitoxin system|nr:putative toxin-antitoxin system toxin component, PIN family [Zoogloeaceae bacterium]
MRLLLALFLFMPSSPLPIVLDTNVVLDILHFQDKAAAPLAKAIAEGRLIALRDQSSLTELRRVLTYPVLNIAPEQAALLLEHYLALTREVACPALKTTGASLLPRCRDPDDQPFLELALRGHALWLVSKDKEVLRMRQQNRPPLPFAILTHNEAAARLAKPDGNVHAQNQSPLP